MIFGGISLCRINKKFLHFFFGLLIVSSVKEHWSITFLSEELYKTSTRGFEIHLSDLCAIVLIGSMLLRKDFKIHWFLPLTIPTFLFILIALISWITVINDYGSSVPNPFYTHSPAIYYPTFDLYLYPLFEISKIIRGFIIYWTTVNLLNDIKFLRTAIISFCVIVVYLTCMSLYLRYIEGDYRVGYLSSANVLGCYAAMLGGFILPLAFQSRKIWQSFFYSIIFLSSFVCVILSLSRAALFGILLTTLFSMIVCTVKFKSFKAKILDAFFIIATILMIVKSFSSLTERGVIEPLKSSEEIRDLLNDEAVKMANNHFFGVGLGNFSAFSIFLYSKLNSAELGNLAHNIWYLTLGEVGWIGFSVFVLYWLIYYRMIIVCYIRRKFDPFKYAVLIGVTNASVILFIQDIYHFTYRITPIFILNQIMMGLVVRLYLSEDKTYEIEN